MARDAMQVRRIDGVRPADYTFGDQTRLVDGFYRVPIGGYSTGQVVPFAEAATYIHGISDGFAAATYIRENPPHDAD